MNVMNTTLTKARPSVKVQALAAFLAVIGAVVVPQIFHVVGDISGLGTALGETFLPMHLPIILAGLLAGPYAGAAAGLLGPLASFAISGMPSAAMLPFMMVELCVYGLTAGLLRNVKLPTVGKVIAVQVAGRAVRACAILLAVFALESTTIGVPVIWTSIVKGLPGLLLQLGLLPLIIYRIENRGKQ